MRLLTKETFTIEKLITRIDFLKDYLYVTIGCEKNLNRHQYLGQKSSLKKDSLDVVILSKDLLETRHTLKKKMSILIKRFSNFNRQICKGIHNNFGKRSI